MIRVLGKGEYRACSNSGREILQITEDGVNAITKEKGDTDVYPTILEVYAQ